ncbi:MAG: FAD-dependent oxidoreductase [Bacilli bacterium]|nr:FAD-dependent oxidoreductase [Bacilli bacterium]
MFDILIVGAGIVGAMIARELSQYSLRTIVIDKENDVGNVTSMANSAIVHSGYDPVPGTLKAKLNVLGNKMFPEVCKELDVSFKQIGSLTVATEDEQLELLKELAERSAINGVDVKLLNRDEVKAIEPYITDDVKGALFAPSAGIVNPFTLTVHAMENAVDNGVILHLGEEVVNIQKSGEFYIVRTNKDIYKTKVIINAAGLYGDKINSMIENIDYSINPRKGEYYVLGHLPYVFVTHTIFPLPSKKGKGILVSPTTSLNFIVGPSSESVESKEDLSTDKLTLVNVKKQAVNLVPKIPFGNVIRTFSGLRATPSTHDFIIGFSKTDKNFINTVGIESPGLASSPAIAKYVVDEFVSKVLPLKVNENASRLIKPRIHPSKLTIDELNELIKVNPSYGRIICNCEKITLGEIEDELSRSVPPYTVKALKKRTRAGFGGCQGGFCQPAVLMLLANHFNKDVTEVLYDKDESNICKYETKKEAR